MSFICHIHNYTEYNEEWNVFSAFNPSKCTHLEQWAADCAAPGEQSWTACRSRDSNPQPWVTSGFKSNALSIRPTTAPLGQRSFTHCRGTDICCRTSSELTLGSWRAWSDTMADVFIHLFCFRGNLLIMFGVSYMWMRHEVGDWYGLCTSSSQTEHVHVFWGYYIGESPDRRDRTFSVGYFQNLATLAGFSNIAYQSFNSVTTKPLIYKCTFSIRYSSIFFSIYDSSQNSFQHP